MADKQISDLTSASSLTDGSLFVLEQGGAAKKANWGMMKNYLSPGIAPQYSTSSTYAVGDYVIHNDQLYRCITAITTAETWTAAHWTAVTLGDDVSDLNSEFRDSLEIKVDTSEITTTSGTLIATATGNVVTGQSAIYSTTDFIDVGKYAGLKFKFTSLFGGWFGLAFYYKNKTLASSYSTAQTGTTADSVATVDITIPAQVQYVRFSMRSTYSSNIADYPILFHGTVDDLIKVSIGHNNLDVAENDFSTISVFENIGVCGDSFASGEIHVGNNVSMYYNLSWPQILARKCGVTVYNYAVSGYSTQSFLTSDTRGLPKLLADEAKDLYIMAFGLNDINIADYLGSISDITSDYTQNPNTFYGNYARIIEQVKSHAPNAKIVLSTMARRFTQTQYKAFDTAIIEIAGHYNIPVVVTTDDPFFDSIHFQNGLVGYHPTAILYGGMAAAYERLFNKSTIKYASYYADYVGN